jgi:hypothetical protein
MGVGNWHDRLRIFVLEKTGIGSVRVTLAIGQLVLRYSEIESSWCTVAGFHPIPAIETPKRNLEIHQYRQSNHQRYDLRAKSIPEPN